MALTQAQKNLLRRFYSAEALSVVLDKKARKRIWDKFKDERGLTPFEFVKAVCPSLHKELEKSLRSGKLVQSAVFSECAYSQTLANLLGLKVFKDASEINLHENVTISSAIQDLNLVVRYVYTNEENSMFLLQAGGAGSIDAALISSTSAEVFRLEYKEPGAKSPEPDLPKYGEDGLLVSSAEFKEKHPQFELMLQEQMDSALNIFDASGSNVNGFTQESVVLAASQSYTGSHHVADAILTEDKQGILTLFPSQDVGMWAQLRGEIRPAGKNAYKVWTPKLLMRTLRDLGANVDEQLVSVKTSAMKTAKPRGGVGLSRYKISPLFFVRKANVTITGEVCEFRIDDIEQLNPTIAAHMFFKTLRYQDAKNHYLDKE